MPISDNILASIKRLQEGEQTEGDVHILRQILSQLNTPQSPLALEQPVQQLGKYNFSSEQANQIEHIGDQIGWGSDEVASFVIRLVQALAPSSMKDQFMEESILDDSWEDLRIDTDALRQLIKQINSRLVNLQNIYKAVELPEKQRLEFNALKSSIYSLRNVERQLEDISRKSKLLLQQVIEELTTKLQEFDALQENHLANASERACTAEHLAALTHFQMELEQGQKLARWINQHQVKLVKQIGQHALDAYPEIKGTATDKQQKNFFLSIEQFLARVRRCLQSGKYDYLDMPSTPIILDRRLYIKAFNRLQELIPNHITAAGTQQLKEYVEYLVDNLPKYELRQ